MLSITKTITGNAVTRQVKRAKQTATKELGKTMTNIFAKGALVAGITSVITSFCDVPAHPSAIFTGTMLGDGLMRNDPELDAALEKYRNLKASDEYKQIVERAKQIKKA